MQRPQTEQWCVLQRGEDGSCGAPCAGVARHCWGMRAWRRGAGIIFLMLECYTPVRLPGRALAAEAPALLRIPRPRRRPVALALARALRSGGDRPSPSVTAPWGGRSRRAGPKKTRLLVTLAGLPARRHPARLREHSCEIAPQQHKHLDGASEARVRYAARPTAADVGAGGRAARATGRGQVGPSRHLSRLPNFSRDRRCGMALPNAERGGGAPAGCIAPPQPSPRRPCCRPQTSWAHTPRTRWCNRSTELAPALS